MDYLWDEEFALFRREGYGPIPYSDGLEVEERLLKIVRNASDRSTFSPELAASISDWPSEYHLSRLRHCLLRPLSIAAGDSVLELGCGCGAVTRYLGEIGADVVAVEGSLLRSRIAAERCRDLPNVKIFADDLLSFSIDRRFDWVLLIGVLEYAPVFSSAQDPVLHYLQTINPFLGPTGRLIVAIENRLGLKYFNGCSEDHLGIPFFGIQDLYQHKNPQTFGRLELIDKLASAGLRHTYFRYPFPDYKLPNVVLSPASLTDIEFDPVDLLSRCHARDYSGWGYRSFDEALTFASLHKNGLVADLSNSFLVEASAVPLPAENSDLAVTFSVSRVPEYATQTRFQRSGKEIRVFKERLAKPHLHSEAQPRIAVENFEVVQILEESEYRAGRQVLWRLLRAGATQCGLDPVVEALHPWMDFLIQHARLKSSEPSSNPANFERLASYDLLGNFIDCTPFNLLESGGELVAIDLEWKSDKDIPLGWVVTRGVLWSLYIGMPMENQVGSVIGVIEALSRRFALAVTAAEISRWLEIEADFQTFATGRPRNALLDFAPSTGLRSFVAEIVRAQGQISDLKHGLTDAQGHIRSVQTDYENQLQAVIMERDRFQGELGAVESERDEARAAVREAREALREGREALRAALADLRETSATLGGTRVNLRDGEKERQRLHQEMVAARSELERRSRQLQVITNSKSWRSLSRLQALARLIPFRYYRYRRRLKSDIVLLSGSTLFDAKWYVANNPDVAAAGVDPTLHYLLHGGDEGRNPSQRFSSSTYLKDNPDVSATGMNPLVHYLRYGVAEGRSIADARGDSRS